VLTQRVGIVLHLRQLGRAELHRWPFKFHNETVPFVVRPDERALEEQVETLLTAPSN
jgi:hypothetical protein